MKTFFRWISATVFLAMALSMSTFADFTSNKKSINSEIVDSKEEQIRTIFDTTSIDPLFNSTPRESKDRVEYSNSQGDISFDLSDGKIIDVKVRISDEERIKTKRVTTTEAIRQCDRKLNDIKELFEYRAEDTFDIISYNELSDDIIVISVAKKEDNGVYNKGESFNICYNKAVSAITDIRAFDYEVNTTNAQVSSDHAMDIASEYIVDEYKIQQCELTYVDPTAYQHNRQTAATQYKLAYQIVFDNGIILIIDAVNGNLLGTDMYLADQARSYAIKETNVKGTWGFRSEFISDAELLLYNHYRNENITAASAAFKRLGYNVTLTKQYNSNAINTSVRNYLKGSSNEYAFYFNGHGDSTVTHMGMLHEIVFSRSHVKGNWHFVYLDGCYTASSTAWADAFHTKGYSKRAFLGWKGTVTLVNSYLFNTKFFPMLNGTKKVEEAAKDAAKLIPGSGTTPIRFFGDTSYNGKAWN